MGIWTRNPKVRRSALTPLHHLSVARMYNFFLLITQFKDLEKFGENLHYIYIRGNLKVLSENSLFIVSYPYLHYYNFKYFENRYWVQCRCSIYLGYKVVFEFFLDQISFYTHRHMYISFIQGWFILIYYHTWTFLTNMRIFPDILGETKFWP